MRKDHQQIVILYPTTGGADEHLTDVPAVACRNGVILYC